MPPLRRRGARRSGRLSLLLLALVGCAATPRGAPPPEEPRRAPDAEEVRALAAARKEVREIARQPLTCVPNAGRALAQLRSLVTHAPDLGVAWLELARAGAVVRGHCERCLADGAELRTITAALERALSLGAVAPEQLARDPDFDPLRTSLWFQANVLRRAPRDAAQVEAALVESRQLVVRGSARGAWGAMSGFDFAGGGRVVAWWIDPDRAEPKVEREARYRVEPDGTVELRLPAGTPWTRDGASGVHRGRLLPGGVLELEGIGNVGDDDAECSA